MNKVLIVIMFILLGTSLIIVSNMNKGVENSFTIEYQNNKNLALPDLTGKQEISTGLYRYYNDGSVTLDYDIYNGEYILNGTNISGYLSIIIYNIVNNDLYIKSYYISGINNDISYPRISIRYNGQPNIDLTNEIMSAGYYINTNVDHILLYLGPSNSYDNYKFKIQIEKGSMATSYVVPKLIPVYKDNLTQQEKNNIGLGAFGGITKIIKTISDIIKPVGDFINGLLSLF